MTQQARMIGRQLNRSLHAWLELAERRQRRRVRMWDPEYAAHRHCGPRAGVGVPHAP